MAQHFRETAALHTDKKKFDDNWEKIVWTKKLDKTECKYYTESGCLIDETPKPCPCDSWSNKKS